MISKLVDFIDKRQLKKKRQKQIKDFIQSHKETSRILEFLHKFVFEKQFESAYEQLRKFNEQMTIHFIQEGNFLEETMILPHTEEMDLAVIEFLKDFVQTKTQVEIFCDKQKQKFNLYEIRQMRLKLEIRFEKEKELFYKL